MPRLTINGARLNVIVQPGPHGAPTLVLLHGFTGSAASWQPVMARLQDMFRCVAIDALGHGDSDAPADPARYGMAHVVGDVLAIMDRLGEQRCLLLGYSMGGRMALQLAVAAPQRLSGLILESASPGLRGADERAARRAADEALARLLEEEGVAAFVDRWERLPLFASQQRLPETTRRALRAQRLRNNPRGLAMSLRGAGTGAQEPLHERLTTLAVPTLLIAGALDDKYCAIARQMATQAPQARLAIVPDAGHNVHLEQPERFVALVREFARDQTLAAPDQPALVTTNTF